MYIHSRMYSATSAPSKRKFSCTVPHSLFQPCSVTHDHTPRGRSRDLNLSSTSENKDYDRQGSEHRAALSREVVLNGS